MFEFEILNLNSKQTLEILKKSRLTLAKIEGKLIGLNEYGKPAADIQAESITFLEKDSVKLEIDPEISVNIERFNLCEIIKTKLLVALNDKNYDKQKFVKNNRIFLEEYITNLEQLMAGKVMQQQSKTDCVDKLKLLKMEAEKFVSIMDEFEAFEGLAKPMMKESYLNLLNQRNNFNQEIKFFKRTVFKSKR